MKSIPTSAPEYQTYRVIRKDREPLVELILEALRGQGCQILYSSPPTEAPFRITFETPEGERLGIVAYAFLANFKETKNRPLDEHRFQLKYGSKDGLLHELWQDPFGLYTTLLLGINTEHGFFVGYDPVLHNPTRFFISLEFKQHHVDQILKKGWHVWERERKWRGAGEPVEVVVGGKPESFLSFVRFERDAVGEDQGHRQLLAERALARRPTVHMLSREFELTEREVLDLIESAHRLKVAVRGSVAEEHLFRQLSVLPEIRSCSRLPGDGPDLSVRLHGGKELTIECKNVLRKTDRDGLARLDFQRTRAAKSDPCSRYYSPKDFDVVAACLHAVTERWEFQFALPARLHPHAKCPGKLSSNVHIDDRWSKDPLRVLRTASSLRLTQ
jgi:restriction-modification system family protein